MRGFIGVRRGLCHLAFVPALLLPLPAAAAPLAVEFEGVIPELTVYSLERIGAAAPVVTIDVVLDVPFAGIMTFDSDKLAAASSGTWAAIPGEVYRDEDPVGGTAAGVETSEWMRTTMTLDTATPVTLAFNRDATNDIAAATDFFLPYEGNQTLFYREGSAYGPSQGDVFAFELRNRLGFSALTGDILTDHARLYDSWLYMAILTSIAFPPHGAFDLVDLFGPGAPTTFLWEDADPNEPTDGRRTLTAASQFSHYVSHVAYDTQLGQLRRVANGYDGDLVLTRMQLRGVAVPEPATGLLVLTGVLGGVAVRRRRASRRGVPVAHSPSPAQRECSRAHSSA